MIFEVLLTLNRCCIAHSPHIEELIMQMIDSREASDTVEPHKRKFRLCHLLEESQSIQDEVH